MDYGIAVKNKFELFLDDEDADPLEILRQKEEENAKNKIENVKGKDTKSQKDSKSAKNKKNNKAQTTVQDQKSKPVEPKDAKKDDQPRNKSRNEDRPNRPPRENRERDLPPRRQQQQDGNRPMSSGGFGGNQTSPPSGNEFRGEGGRGRGRGRGGRGGGRGRGGFDRFGKREFERHSGSDKTSGIKATEKRDGGGAHNWGTVKDDMEDQLNATTAPAEGNAEWTPQSEDAENQQPDAAPENSEETPQEEEQQTASEMTLDEWKALQNKEKQTTAFNVRKPGEGCDSKQWKQTYVLKKKVDEHDEEEEESDDEDYEDDHRKKNYVPIEITFGDSRRGGSRGGRGGRGRGGMDRRGRGGRGGPNSGRGGGGRREQAPNVEDELDFPSLGKPAA